MKQQKRTHDYLCFKAHQGQGIFQSNERIYFGVMPYTKFERFSSLLAIGDVHTFPVNCN
jgi:hypothetical protein